MNKTFTRNGVHSYVSFEDNRNYLTRPLLVHTKFWNDYIPSVGPNAYLCYFVRKDTSTDGASIPNLATRLLGLCPRAKTIFFPGLIHDDLYQKKKLKLYYYNKVTGEKGDYCTQLDITQKMADDNIRYECKKWGMNIIKRTLVRLGLRVGGWKARNSYILK